MHNNSAIKVGDKVKFRNKVGEVVAIIGRSAMIEFDDNNRTITLCKFIEKVEQEDRTSNLEITIKTKPIC